MSVLVIPLALLLFLVFATSALGKLLAADRGQGAFDALRIPVRRPKAVAMAVVVCELGIALALVTTSSWVLAAAAGLAAAFTVALLVVVVRAHRLGSTEDCGCFGEWFPSRVSASLIRRNVALVVSAATLTFLSMVAALSDQRLGFAVLFSDEPSTEAESVFWALAACIFTALVVGATIHAFDRSMPEHAPAASSQGSGVVLLPHSGTFVDLASPGSRARLVVFLRVGCRACIAVYAVLAEATESLNAVVDVYVVYSSSEGHLDDFRALAAPAGALLAVDVAGSLSRHLVVGAGRPVAALVGVTGEVAAPIASGTDEISLLVQTLVTVSESADTQ